jgi:hypothetical protein
LFVLNVTAHPTPHGEDGSFFTPEAYPVKWKRDDPKPAAGRPCCTPELLHTRGLSGEVEVGRPKLSPPHDDDLAARRSSFMPEAYPVKWKRDDPSPPQDGLAARQSSFTPEAYSMKWFDPPPHKDLAARQSSFTPESYPAGAVERKQGSRRMVRTCIFFFHHI